MRLLLVYHYLGDLLASYLHVDVMHWVYALAAGRDGSPDVDVADRVDVDPACVDRPCADVGVRAEVGQADPVSQPLKPPANPAESALLHVETDRDLSENR